MNDENNQATTFSVTTVNAWSGTTNLGHITGNNTGVFPDAVLQTGLLDSSRSEANKNKRFKYSKQYNIGFVGSQNEGVMALSSYSKGLQTSTLNARYNTNQTASLNNLIPDANGEILVTITRGNSSPVSYLNGLVIEEYDQSVQMLSPANLFAETINRTSVKLTWTDRTNNENLLAGYELVRASDSLFTNNVSTISLPANSTSYTDNALAPDTKYWYRVRAKGLLISSDYSKRVKALTPATMVYVNFNTTVANAPSPWNNLVSSPIFNFTTPALKDQSGATTKISLTLEKEFNGEFTAGMSTGNNSGVVPDNVLASNYWLDKKQLSQFKVNGLNHSKRYRVGFIGSSAAPWFKGNYTAAYSINQRTVYLNSWQNTSKIVYIGDVAPDADGKVLLNFSTTEAAGYGFNAGIILEEYSETLGDTIPNTPPDTTDTTPEDTTVVIPNPPGDVDTLPEIPDPVDTIPDTPDPVRYYP